MKKALKTFKSIVKDIATNEITLKSIVVVLLVTAGLITYQVLKYTFMF